ncbi:hypothetical protein M0R45_005559 [Rubus argutus]
MDPPPLGLSQRISTCLNNTISLLCLWPRSESSCSNQLPVDDLEGLPPENQIQITVITAFLPHADQLVMTTERCRLCPRSVGSSSPTDGRALSCHWIADHTWQRSWGLPVHCNDNHYRTQHMESRQQPQLGWEKTIISLTFQAVIGLTLAGQPPDGGNQLHHLHIFGTVILFAFASSFSAILVNRVYPRTRAASILEKMGYLSVAFGFYLITSIFLPNHFT